MEPIYPITLGEATFLDHFGYLLSGFFLLLAFLDLFFPDNVAAFIISGFIFSVPIYGICYIFYEANLEEGKVRVFKLIRFLLEGNSYWKHMRYIAESTGQYTDKYSNSNTNEINFGDIRPIFNAYKIWEDIETKGIHEPAHNMASFYWLFSTCSFSIFLGCVSRFIFDIFSEPNFNLEYYAILLFLLIIFRGISIKIAKHIDEFDDIVISYGFSDNKKISTLRRLTKF